MESEKILALAANALNDKKAVDIKAIKIGDLTVLSEYFLIASGTSSTHVHALADEVEDKLKEADVIPHHIEGRSTGWYVLDYGTVIVHIFSRDQREFYGLEKMWADGEEIDCAKFLNKPEGE
ncbi:MAG: ribosome silencing factor [Clostridia bacterium]|nr:ribosome silencing factor [Clostridia bacterium]